MKKRRLLALFAATAVLAGTMLAVGCGKDSEPSASEKYTGVVSTQSYTNTESAASACIATEVSGEDYQVTYERYEKEATLTESEVTALNISSEVNGTVESVEKGKIYFSEVSAANAIATAAGEVDLYITVYIIKYTPQGTSVSEYKYVVPLPANNEVLTYSYYDSVMNPDNYKNCTMNAKISMSVKYGGQTESSSTSYTMQITETAAKLNSPFRPNSGPLKLRFTSQIPQTDSGALWKCRTAERKCACLLALPNSVSTQIRFPSSIPPTSAKRSTRCSSKQAAVSK